MDKGDRHKPGRKRPYTGTHAGKGLNKWTRRRIIAWDGEGANLKDGTHVYNLLANSEGLHILNHEGLGTEEIFEFMVRYSDPKAINVIFGGSYDVNMILVDVPKDLLTVLWTTGECYWKHYRIFYANRKKFTVQSWYINETTNKLNHKDFVLWDVLGFFQSSFVVACRKWLGALPVLDEIERMKLERSVFNVDRIDEIIKYNAAECALLVQLIEALFAAMDTAEITLVRYDGAGAIASALLKKNSILSHKGEVPPMVNRWAQIAYSGGRIEAPKIGNYDGHIERNDINSAYPSQMLALPSYKDAEWSFDKEWDGSENSMVHIRWYWEEDAPFYPLWYRQLDGSILYPKRGEGIYWGNEVRNLDQYHRGQYEVLEACNVQLAHQYHPFHFVREGYETRLMFKAVGSMASEALKLGLNSLYGKLAQQSGYRNGRIPTYHQLLWAGQITAGTRAQLYRAAMQKPGSIVAFATDALISTEALNLTLGTGLGEWTHDEFDGITIVQPGVYWLKGEDGWHDKYRGFDPSSLDRRHIIGSWVLGHDFTARLTRFIGIGSALASTHFEERWRTWQTEPRVLGITPSGKRSPGKNTCYWETLCDTVPTENLNLDLMSMPYPLLWDGNPKDIRPKTDGIDVDLIEREYIDGYA